MGIANSFRQLGRDLRSQKLRTFLTTFGIVWGTVAVSLLLSFGDGLHRQMLKNSAGIGDGIIIAWPSKTSIPYEGLGRGRRIRVNEEDIELVRKRAELVEAVSSEYMTTLKLRQGTRTLAVDVSGVHPTFGPMRSLIPQQGGRFINPIDEKLKRRVAFLGNELAENLYGSSDPIGQVFRLNGSPFTVIGVLKQKVQDSSYSGRDKDKIFVPGATMRAITGQKFTNNIIFTARPGVSADDATDEVRGILAGKHRFDPEDKEALAVWDTTQMAAFLNDFMLGFKLFLGVVGSLTLVVGGIGVSNIMNVVVEERTREIGIKMALGARPRSVLGQFLGETLIMTTFGGILGLLITAGICAVFPAFNLTEELGTPQVSASVAASTAAMLGLLGLLAGYFPARTAALLDPVVAMKM